MPPTRVKTIHAYVVKRRKKRYEKTNDLQPFQVSIYGQIPVIKSELY